MPFELGLRSKALKHFLVVRVIAKGLVRQFEELTLKYQETEANKV